MIFDEQELENLKRLLGSSDCSNIRLGLELLQQNPKNSEACIIPLLVLANFAVGYYEEEARKNQELALKLLNKHVPKNKCEAHLKNLEVFETVADYKSMSWKGFYKQLQQYEAHIEVYEPYILANPDIVYHYHELVEYMRYQFNKSGYTLPYLKKLLKTAYEPAKVKTNYVDIAINEWFAEDKHLDEIPTVIIELEALMKYYPSFSHQYYNLIGIVYDIYVLDKEKAKLAYRESIKLNPNNCGALNNLANILYKFDDNATEALELVNRALKQDKNNVHYLDTLGYLKFKAYNDLKTAEKCFRKVMKLDPTHHAAITGLGEVMEAKGKYEEALDLYTKGLKLSHKSEFKLTKIADLLYLKLKRPEEALPHYKKLARYYKQNLHAKEMKKRITKELKS